MKRLGIEINCAGLIVADAERILVEEPGYAIVDAGGITTGAAAYAQARLKPARMRNAFWSGLTVEGGGAEANGELAFEHLRRVWELANRRDASAVVVVPGHYDAQQLGLVLGIAQECGIQVEALADVAVCASTLEYPGRELLYVDATLHSVTVSRIEQAGSAAVDRFEASHGTGLAAFTDEMARAIARVFVLDTRFDPLHGAGTEQALYDGLPGWLAALHREGEVVAELEHAGQTLSVELTAERLRSASLRLFREIVQLIGRLSSPGIQTVVQLNSRLATLPGLRTELARIEGIELVELDRGAPVHSALRRVPERSGGSDEVPLLRRLPFTGLAQTPPPQAAMPAPAPRRPAPTHVVHAGIGYRLQPGRIEIAGAAGAIHNGTQTIAIGGDTGGRDRAKGRAEASARESATDSASDSEVRCALENTASGLRVVPAADVPVFINDRRVADPHSLETGDVLRIGEPGAVLHIVAVES